MKQRNVCYSRRNTEERYKPLPRPQLTLPPSPPPKGEAWSPRYPYRKEVGLVQSLAGSIVGVTSHITPLPAGEGLGRGHYLMGSKRRLPIWYRWWEWAHKQAEQCCPSSPTPRLYHVSWMRYQLIIRRLYRHFFCLTMSLTLRTSYWQAYWRPSPTTHDRKYSVQSKAVVDFYSYICQVGAQSVSLVSNA